MFQTKPHFSLNSHAHGLSAGAPLAEEVVGGCGGTTEACVTPKGVVGSRRLFLTSVYWLQ